MAALARGFCHSWQDRGRTHNHTSLQGHIQHLAQSRDLPIVCGIINKDTMSHRARDLLIAIHFPARPQAFLGSPLPQLGIQAMEALG